MNNHLPRIERGSSIHLQMSETGPGADVRSWTPLPSRMRLEMKIPERFRLANHLVDPNASRTIRHHPVDGVALLIAQG